MKRAALLVIGLLVVGILACNGTPEAEQIVSSPEVMQSPETEPAIEEPTNTSMPQPTNTPKPPTPVPSPIPSPTPPPIATDTPIPAPILIEFNGDGDEATELFYLREGLLRCNYSNAGDSNFIVDLLDSQGNGVALLANDIGPCEGSSAQSIDRSGDYLLGVSAWGNWSITLQQ